MPVAGSLGSGGVSPDAPVVGQAAGSPSRGRAGPRPAPAFAATFTEAYRASHGGQEPAYTLVTRVASTAENLLAHGSPAEDLKAAVIHCARSNKGAALLDVVLGEIQSTSRARPPGGRSRSEVMAAWEKRHEAWFKGEGLAP